MMTPGQRVVWQMADSSIRVGTWIDKTLAEFIAKVEAGPDYVGAIRLPFPADDDPLPDIRWRDCWRNRGDGRIHVDMPMARAQRLEEIRVERNVLFAPLDAEWMKAMGQKNQAEADLMEAKRQQLRDIPNTLDLDSISKLEVLEAFEPEWPKGMR